MPPPAQRHPGSHASQRVQPYRPSRYAWSAVAPLLGIPGIALILVALAITWGPAMGGGDWTVCYSEPLSYAFSTSAVQANLSFWPLGVDCVYGAGTTDAFTIHEDRWLPAILATMGLAIIAASIIGTISAYTRWFRR